MYQDHITDTFMPSHKTLTHILSFGLEITDARGFDVQYFDSDEAREEHLRSLSAQHTQAFYLGPRRVRRCILLNRGGAYVEEVPAVHEHWRKTMLHLNHKTRHAYMEQVAMVDLIRGRVVVVDAEKPFTPDQHAQWNRHCSLVEFFPHDRISQWISLEAPPKGSWYHYQVCAKDMGRLQNSEPADPMVERRPITGKLVEPELAA